jgi:small subunit ribosomal protein S16
MLTIALCFPFHPVVADARAPRDGRFIEQIGTYAPLPTKGGEKHLTIKSDRFKYWMSVGAQPSDPVAKLLAQVRWLLLFCSGSLRGCSLPDYC